MILQFSVKSLIPIFLFLKYKLSNRGEFSVEKQKRYCYKNRPQNKPIDFKIEDVMFVHFVLDLLRDMPRVDLACRLCDDNLRIWPPNVGPPVFSCKAPLCRFGGAQVENSFFFFE